MNKDLSNQAQKNLLKAIDLVKDVDVKKLILKALANYMESLKQLL